MPFQSRYPLLRLKSDIHEHLQVVETEWDAVVREPGLILERPEKGPVETRCLTGILTHRGFDSPAWSARRLDVWMVARTITDDPADRSLSFDS